MGYLRPHQSNGGILSAFRGKAHAAISMGVQSLGLRSSAPSDLPAGRFVYQVVKSFIALLALTLLILPMLAGIGRMRRLPKNRPEERRED